REQVMGSQLANCKGDKGMPDPKGYSLIGAALAHLIDSMNKANAWKDHSAELVEIAAAFRRIAEPLGPEGLENALQAYVESEHKDERATYAKIGTTLIANIQFILRRTNPLEDSGRVTEFAIIFGSIASPLGP
ncbi:hypothetical protein ACFL2Q_14415, partial [Thermodesulfobacteriota bacterium]